MTASVGDCLITTGTDSPLSLLSIPTWNQLSDPLADGEQDPYAESDCGEECAAMRIWYRRGIALPAGIIRQLIPDHQARGETTPAELVAVMRLFGLSPVALSYNLGAARIGVAQAIAHAIPPIVLGYWESRTVLHYVLGVGSGNVGLACNDPWNGRRRVIPWSEFDGGYAGWVIS